MSAPALLKLPLSELEYRARALQDLEEVAPVLGSESWLGQVKQLGGEIQVESSMGQGSLFRVVLPPHSVRSEPLGTGRVVT